jgi:hypothetical protein
MTFNWSFSARKTGIQNRIDNFCQSNAIKSCIWHKTREEVIKTLTSVVLVCTKQCGLAEQPKK